MPKRMSETDARLLALQLRVEAIEAFLGLRDGYRVSIGQNIAEQQKIKLQKRAEATKLRLEKEKLLPLIQIHSVKRRFDGTGIIANFVDLRQEGVQTRTSAAMSEEAANKLREGELSGFHMVQLSKYPNRIFAKSSEVKDLPQRYEARIIKDTPIELQVDNDAFQDF
mgnify:FL=1